MKRYVVRLSGTIYASAETIVEAEDEDQAAEIALEEAPYLEWEIESDAPQDPEIAWVEEEEEE